MFIKKKSILSAIVVARAKRTASKKNPIDITLKNVKDVLVSRLPALDDTQDERIQKYIDATSTALKNKKR